MLKVSLQVVVIAVLASVVRGQSSQQPQKGTEGPRTVVMTECEGVNDCATWKFSRKQGNYL